MAYRMAPLPMTFSDLECIIKPSMLTLQSSAHRTATKPVYFTFTVFLQILTAYHRHYHDLHHLILTRQHNKTVRLASLVVYRASDLRLHGHEFDPGRRTIGRLVLGWVTVFARAYHLVCNQPPGQLSLLPFVGLEMSTGQSAVMLCGWV